MSLNSTATSRPRAASGLLAWSGLALLAAATAGLTGSMPQQHTQPPVAVAAPAREQAIAPASPAAPAAEPVVVAQAEAPRSELQAMIAFRQNDRPAIGFRNDRQYYDQLRSRLHWEDVRVGERKLRTPDEASRILLTQAAAQRAKLNEVGLSFRDVYGIINAETSWIPRMGASKDGTPNLGIAQFEPATARALGLRNPNDPVESVHVMALHLKDAAEWSAKRLAGLKLSPEQYALKLREGLSIYYNLSSKGRAMWNGTNTAKLPIETRRHIANARRGALEADQLAAQLASIRARVQAAGVMTASTGGGDS